MSNVNDGEIDLKDLFSAVLATRYSVFMAIVLLSIGFWAFQSAKNIVKPSVHAHSVRINLVFPGVEKFQYPNASPFALGDIISPVVLSEVYTVNNLDEFIAKEVFISSFSVQPFTPERAFILARYASLLSNNKLTNAEIEGLQKSLKDELDRASITSVIITFSGEEVEKIPGEVLTKIMFDVPQYWSNHMIENIGVTQNDTPIYSSRALDDNLLWSIDYLIAFEVILDSLRLLDSNIEQLMALPNGPVTYDDETGYLLPDLEKAVRDIRRYRVSPLVMPVRRLGIAKDPELVLLYFENELFELRRRELLLTSKKSNLENTYNTYLQNGVPTVAAGSDAGLAAGGGMIPQVGEEFLDRIIELTNSGADIAYRQELNVKLLEISDELSDVSSEIARIQEILDSFKRNNSDALKDRYASHVETELPKIVDSLRGYFDISVRISKKLSHENLGSAGELYNLADGEIDSNVSRNIFMGSNIRLYFVLLFLTVIVVVPVVMIRNVMIR